MTVERDKVDVYAQLANVLFKNLFGVELVRPVGKGARLLGDVLEAWIELERNLVSLAHDNSPVGAHGASLVEAARLLRGTDMVTASDVKEFQHLQQLRNKIVHGAADHREVLTPDIVARVRVLKDRFGEGP